MNEKENENGNGSGNDFIYRLIPSAYSCALVDRIVGYDYILHMRKEKNLP